MLLIVELSCDKCTQRYHIERELLEFVWSRLEKRGWIWDGTKHYCPKCASNSKADAHAQLMKIFEKRLN
jgi:hypothetical protein